MAGNYNENPTTKTEIPKNNIPDVNALLRGLKLESPLAEKVSALEDRIKTSNNPEEQYDLRRELYRIARIELAKNGKMNGIDKEKVRKILKNKNLEDARSGDVLLLGKSGMNLSSILISDSIDPSKDLGNEKMQVGQKIVVNFGSNEKINNKIGAGDILPIEVESIRMTPKNNKQKDKTPREGVWGAGPRPGFYDTKGYIPVYDGDTIEVTKTREITPEFQKQWNLVKSNRFREVRIDEMIQSGIKNHEDPRIGDEFTDLDDDFNIASGIENENKERLARKSVYKQQYQLDGMNRINFESRFGDFVNKRCSQYNVPVLVVMGIFANETVGGFKFDQTSSAKAFGIGQITPDTWDGISKRIGRTLEKENPMDQIEATIENLSNHKRNSTDWIDALIKYHTGNNANASNLESYKLQNPAIAKLMETPDWNGYREAVSKFYGIKNGFDEKYQINVEQYKVGKITDIKSSAGVIKEGGMTYCSRTTRLDAEMMFGAYIPQAGSALDSGDLYTKSGLYKNQVGLGEGNDAFNTAPKNANFADIILYSNTKNGGGNGNDNGNGHRCLAFRSENIWYVLDPYNGADTATPFPSYLSHYKQINGADIKKVGFYNLPPAQIRDYRVAQKIDTI